jgi:hypothetical protein
MPLELDCFHVFVVQQYTFVISNLFICGGEEKNFVARCGEKYANQFIGYMFENPDISIILNYRWQSLKKILPI